MPNPHVVRGMPTEIFRRSSSGAGEHFSVSAKGENMVVESSAIGGTMTALTVDLEVSSDQGVTWQKLQTGIALIAAGVATAARINITGLGGLQCRFNATTLTLNTATAVAILANAT